MEKINDETYNLSRALTLEQRIARLELFIVNENRSGDLDNEFIVGDLVRDADGDKLVVCEVGDLLPIRSRWINKVTPANRKEVIDFMDEMNSLDIKSNHRGHSSWTKWSVVVCKYVDSGEYVIHIDPENGLEVIGNVGNDYNFESHSRRFSRMR